MLLSQFVEGAVLVRGVNTLALVMVVRPSCKGKTKIGRTFQNRDGTTSRSRDMYDRLRHEEGNITLR